MQKKIDGLIKWTFSEITHSLDLTMEDTAGSAQIQNAEQPDNEQFEEPPAEEDAQETKFTQEQLSELVETYKLFIKKKQPNSVWFIYLLLFWSGIIL